MAASNVSAPTTTYAAGTVSVCPPDLGPVVGYGDGMATMQPDLVAWALGPDGAATSALLRLAGQQVDGDLGTVRLLRRGTNLVLASDERKVVLRLQYADRADEIDANLRLCRDVADAGGPVVPPLAPRCALADGVALTAWPMGIPAAADDQAALGNALRDLHAVPPAADLPSINVSDRFEARLGDLDPTIPGWIAESLKEHAVLAVARLDELVDRSTVLLHADAHVGNLVTWDRGWGLIDLDDLCRGPREFDLAPSLVSYQRFHRDRHRWHAFKEAYGEADWEAVSYLSVVRESTMNTWLAGLWTYSEPARDELAHRVRTWDQDPAVHDRWSAL